MLGMPATQEVAKGGSKFNVTSSKLSETLSQKQNREQPERVRGMA
jgi:hypothetical protein